MLSSLATSTATDFSDATHNVTQRSETNKTLSFNWTTRALAGTSVCPGTLAAQRKSTTMTNAAVTTEIHQALDIHRCFSTKITLDLKTRNSVTDFCHLRFRKVFNLHFGRNTRGAANLLRA